MEVLALIPARSGSKSITDKNIRNFRGQPLLTHSIQHALSTNLINRVIVSTNCEKYRDIAIQYGAEVPFLRPQEFSKDLSTDIEVFTHALKWLEDKENYRPDLIVHLRPTTPIRVIQDIDNCIDIIKSNDKLDSVRSITRVSETPYKMWRRNEDGTIKPVLELDDLLDAHSMPRQILPVSFLQNASIDVIRYNTIMNKKSMVGDKCFGYIMKNDFDIDYEHHWNYAEAMSKLNDDETMKTFCFDIDGVLASLVANNDYNLAAPITENIELVNTLFNKGHQIVLYTARGSKTGINWFDITRKQMKSWGVKYHSLDIGRKPAADFYIDDRLIEIDLLKKIYEDKKT